MKRIEISSKDFEFNPIKELNAWMLLTSGDLGKKDFNSMTVSWGTAGIMWGKPVVFVAVHPDRYTYGFMEKYDSFTLCSFPQSFKQTLGRLGTKSGRDIDKIGASGLTPEASIKIAAPCYEEAELVIECKKLYSGSFEMDRFVEREIPDSYKGSPMHKLYIGEIVSFSAAAKYHGRV